MKAQNNQKREGIYVSSPACIPQVKNYRFCQWLYSCTGLLTTSWKTGEYHPKYPSSEKVIGLPKYMIVVTKRDNYIGYGSFKEIQYAKKHGIPIIVFFEDSPYAQIYEDDQLTIKATRCDVDFKKYATIEKVGRKWRYDLVEYIKAKEKTVPWKEPRRIGKYEKELFNSKEQVKGLKTMKKTINITDLSDYYYT